MPGLRLSNAFSRILTAVVGIPLIVFVTYLGGWPFLLLVLLAALIAQVELYWLAASAGVRVLRVAGLVVGVFAVLRIISPLGLPLAVMSIVVIMLAIPFLPRVDKPLETVAVTLAGAVYPTVLLSFLIDLRFRAGDAFGDRGGLWLTLAVFILVWTSDTAAYYVGKLVGRRPLAPSISPNKTWEGAIGGGLAAVAVGLLLDLTVLDFLATPHCVALAIICGSIGQVGDLAESRLKRSVGVKDSGGILPGHGGLLDRFDALIVAAPLAYLYLAYVAAII